MAKNLTEEELKKVQELNQKFLQTKIEIADAFVALVKKVPNLDGIQTQFGELEKELISVYGENAVIDLRTGEVKEPEKETSDGKDK
mgnify:FL=1|tara:strand:+ start:67 stop:324 length:258 start_codon:yes stop_codon:yes gene_type:complete